MLHPLEGEAVSQHEIVGAEPCSGILGAIVCMNQCSYVVLPP